MSARSLSISEYLQLPEVLCCLAFARWQVLWRPARSWIPKGRGGGDELAETDTDPAFSSHQLTRARSVARLVRGMAVRVPWKTHCLDEALALHYMLRRRAVRHRFHFGVHKSGNTELKAHAWVSVGPSVVIGSAGRQEYREVAVIEL